jgi:hypothetical protein
LSWTFRFQSKWVEVYPPRYWNEFLSQSPKSIQRIFLAKNDLVFCNKVYSFIKSLGHQRDPTEWRLWTDSSEICLKAVLHNGNKFPSVLLAHATNMKGSYVNIKLLLAKIWFEKYN